MCFNNSEIILYNEIIPGYPGYRLKAKHIIYIIFFIKRLFQPRDPFGNARTMEIIYRDILVTIKKILIIFLSLALAS